VAKKPSPQGTLIPVSASRKLSSELQNITENLTNNPNVTKFVVSVNKGTGIAKVMAVGHNGNTVTNDILGPGLMQTMTYTPSDKAARDSGICTLYQRGLTQTQIAQRIDVSQALVSNVLRRSGLC
jgi:DNA-binding NarL/FixJ family response regulator